LRLKLQTTPSPIKKPGKAKHLPPATASEAAFERVLAELALCHGERRDAELVEAERSPTTTANLSSFLEDAFARREEYSRDPYSSIGDALSFHSKIVGVSFEGRQDTIAGLHEGALLDLVREPNHEKDPNAIAVFYGHLSLGYLRAEIAKHLAPLIDLGARYRARIENLTGGPSSALQNAARPGQARERNRGVNIVVERDAAADIAERTRERASRRSAPEQSAQENAAAVRRALIGDAQPHDYQLAVLERIERSVNTLALFGTGRGKSFCFQFPAVVRALADGGHKTLAIYPLRALANDQYDALVRRLEQFGLAIFRANGSISAQEREELFDALREGAWDVVLSTPEFLAFHRALFRGVSRPSFVVVDEAHHVHESRHRAAYAGLGETIAALGNPQVLALTATAADEAFAKIREMLGIDSWVIDPTIRENLHLVDARAEKDKVAYLQRIFEDGEKGIVYCNSRDQVGKIADQLRRRLGDVAMYYHAGMPSQKRREVEEYFRSGALRTIVATSAFGEGIDLPDVRHVCLYHLNFSFTEFNQQAGRAGRDGGPASVHLLFNERDRRLNEFILERDAPTISTLRSLYAGMKSIARNAVLRDSPSDIVRELDRERLHENTVVAALRTFEDEGLVEIAEDDEGRYVRFLPVSKRIDLTRNERFAEGEAERESFARFADMALTAKIDDLERLVNRAIYPDVSLLA
jgi:single-stranded-DNA-specific exonuclease